MYWVTRTNRFNFLEGRRYRQPSTIKYYRMSVLRQRQDRRNDFYKVPRSECRAKLA